MSRVVHYETLTLTHDFTFANVALLRSALRHDSSVVVGSSRDQTAKLFNATYRLYSICTRVHIISMYHRTIKTDYQFLIISDCNGNRELVCTYVLVCDCM